MRTLILSASLAYLLMAGRVVVGVEEELRFNGNEGNNQQLDTNIRPSNDQANQRPSSPGGMFNSDSSWSQSNMPIQRFSHDSEWSSLFGNPSNDIYSPILSPASLINDILESINRQQTIMDQTFQTMEQQAGEGQDISYFNRNGIEYVRTCKTRRLSQGGEKVNDPDVHFEIMPSNPNEMQQQRQDTGQKPAQQRSSKEYAEQIEAPAGENGQELDGQEH